MTDTREEPDYDLGARRFRDALATAVSASVRHVAPLTIHREQRGPDNRPLFRGKVSTLTYTWESDNPSDIVAWWLQGCPKDGPTLLGKTTPEDDEEREPFTPEERLLIRGMLREKATEISALIMKLDGGG